MNNRTAEAGLNGFADLMVIAEASGEEAEKQESAAPAASEEAKTEESTKQEAGDPAKTTFGSTQFALILYAGLLLFMGYNYVKSLRSKAKVKGEKTVFHTKTGWSILILILAILGLGIGNVVIGEYATGAVMIALSIIFALQSREPIIVSEEGIYADTQYYPWTDVRRWGWDRSKGDLVVITKEFGKDEQSHYLRIGKQHMNEVNQKIREYKLGKKPVNQQTDSINDTEDESIDQEPSTRTSNKKKAKKNKK